MIPFTSLLVHRLELLIFFFHTRSHNFNIEDTVPDKEETGKKMAAEEDVHGAERGLKKVGRCRELHA